MGGDEGGIVTEQWRDYLRAAIDQGPAAWGERDARADRGPAAAAAPVRGVVTSPTFDVRGRANGCVLVTGPLKATDLDDLARADPPERRLAGFLFRFGRTDAPEPVPVQPAPARGIRQASGSILASAQDFAALPARERLAALTWPHTTETRLLRTIFRIRHEARASTASPTPHGGSSGWASSSSSWPAPSTSCASTAAPPAVRGTSCSNRTSTRRTPIWPGLSIASSPRRRSSAWCG
ncbi:hypothetical protein V5P93_002061 [Actinokineospora auranticolor]|uniref:hypothetical protein n=1 Tax=Actinokineospora auranticolor TaxID=155976 RepID=UPI000CEC59AA|nr:hypothetical protein [Actinokineospora auranticolor]